MMMTMMVNFDRFISCRYTYVVWFGLDRLKLTRCLLLCEKNEALN